MIDKIELSIFHSIEKAIKTYRQFAQKQIKKAHLEITIDQWLVLKTIQEQNDISQQQIANNVFKDYASVTRMIELLVKNQYLTRDFHSNDRRRFDLRLTKKGTETIEAVFPIIQENRKIALKNIPQTELKKLQHSLIKIINNCQ